jgi:hypothetical protein
MVIGLSLSLLTEAGGGYLLGLSMITMHLI